MKGDFLVDLLLEEFDCDNDNQLAKRIDVTSTTVGNWRKKSVSKTVLRRVFHKIANRVVEPIVEFHELDFIHGSSSDTFLKRINNSEFSALLKVKSGIYSFYDSNGRIIYAGKTQKSNLLNEMKQAYNISRPQFKRKFKDGKKFYTYQMSISDSAVYFSAYKVHSAFIGNLEALITRLIPNDIVNKRTENFR